MKLAVDVYYQKNKATAAGVLFPKWTSVQPLKKFVSHINQVEEYIPGQFYKRELPCILKLIHKHKIAPNYIIIDGYVYLDGSNRPGLGKYLYERLNATIPVIGVAKNPFKNISEKYKIYRRNSIKPLYVTAAGLPLDKAKKYILKMQGSYRIPDLLREVDQLSKCNYNI